MKKQRHPMSETIRGEGIPAFRPTTRRVASIERARARRDARAGGVVEYVAAPLDPGAPSLCLAPASTGGDCYLPYRHGGACQ